MSFRGSGAPHPISIVVGMGTIAAAFYFSAVATSDPDFWLGSFLSAVPYAVLALIGVHIGGGKVTRWSLMPNLGKRQARIQFERHIDEETSQMVRPTVGFVLTLACSAFFFLKPILFPAHGRRVYFDERPPEEVTWGFFEASHRAFVIASAVFALLALFLLVRMLIQRQMLEAKIRG